MAHFDVKDQYGFPQMFVGGVDVSVVSLHDEIEEKPLPGETVGNIAVDSGVVEAAQQQVPITRIANMGQMALVGRIAEMKLDGSLDAQPACPEIVQEIVDYAKEVDDPANWLTAC